MFIMLLEKTHLIIRRVLNMSSIHLFNLKKLTRKNNNLYLTTATIKEIREWQLHTSSFQRKEEIINLYTNNVTVIKEEGGFYDLEVKNAYLLTHLPDLELEEEVPVLINNNSKLTIVTNALLQIESFKKFIEINNDKISNNSTKIMTLKTLESLVSYVFDDFTLDELTNLINEFVTYIQKTISNYDIFTYYSVKHIKGLKRTSIIHSSFSWYIIFRFFIENFRSQVYKTVNIPKLDLDVQVGNWKGRLFDKSNPIWDEIYNGKRRFYPTKENLEVTYKVWKEYYLSLC